MKVLYATMQYGRGYAQGTERYISILTRGLRARGHQTVVLAGDPENRGPELPLGTALENDPGVKHYPSRAWMGVQGLPAEALMPLLREEKPDLIHIANPAHIGLGLFAAARQMHIPAVFTVMDFWWICPKHTLFHYHQNICEGRRNGRECLRCIAATHPKPFPRTLARIPLARDLLLPPMFVVQCWRRGVRMHEVRRWFARNGWLTEVLHNAHAIIFPSRTAEAKISPHLGHRRSFTIPYGIEPNWFAARRPVGATPSQAAKPPEDLTIGYAGALAAHKGVHLLLEAVRQLGWTRTRIRLAGKAVDPAYLVRLRELAKGLNVEYLGAVPSAKMIQVFGELDVLVIPSIWPENLPLVVLEALATGTPVLASRVDGIAELVTDSSYLFDVNDAESLAQRLSAWAKSPTVYSASLSTADEMTERTLEVYRQFSVPTSWT